MMIPLVIVLWEGENYRGRKRQFVEDSPNLVPHAFNDHAQAVGVHPGPDYDAWKAANPGQEPFVVLYTDADYEGRGLGLTGGLPTLSDPVLPIQFIGLSGVSSLRINPPRPLREDWRQVDVFFPGISDGLSPALDARITPIKRVVVLYQNPFFTGNRYVIVESQDSIAAALGTDLNGVSSALVLPGPDDDGGVATLFDQEGRIGQPMPLGVGGYSNLNDPTYNFAGRTRSITV